MLKRQKITVIFIIFIAVIFLLPSSVLAEAGDVYGINDFSDAGVALGTKSLKDIIGGIVNIFLGFLGILATLIILYGGYIWMTSGGNAEKVDQAKRIIINGVIGLAIIVSSYAIARFILKEGYESAFGPSGGHGGPEYVGGVGLGAGALESHYPPRNANDVARNTNIYLTFKEPIDLDFMVSDSGCTPGVDCFAHPDHLRLYAQGNPEPITGGDLVIVFTPYDDVSGAGQRVFQINPYGPVDGDDVEYLGSPSADVRHRMELIDIETLNGSAAFPITGSYDWNFTVGTELDLTPPTITYVVPTDGSEDNPMNSVVQINFSEAVDPISASGMTVDGFDNITVSDIGPLVGGYYISNQYRTVEFLTNNFCGVNTCGGDVFCLPGEALLNGFVSGTAPDDMVADRYEAIVDMADNVLDCTGGCEIDGDNYIWSFSTSNEIDLEPPIISHMDNPNNLGLTDPIEVEFSEGLLASSINSSNIGLEDISGPINFWLRLIDGDTISIRHDRLEPSSIYTPTMTSGIKDSRQNCWYPCECAADDASCVCSTPDCGPGVSCEGTDGEL